ncbi:MAG: translesion error-prone DNA polymerase V autoproteolytic subunit [Planctomycetota bacterium]
MPRGGKRPGAGRPVGTGKYGERTRVVRIPERMVREVLRFARHKGYALPLYQSRVSAGFPSPADDYLEGRLDLNDHLVKNPAATFFVRVSGESMTGAGIFPDDILVVDRSLEARHGSVVIAVVNGELAVKRLSSQNGRIELRAENPAFGPIPIGEATELEIWGVVRHVIHAV